MKPFLSPLVRALKSTGTLKTYGSAIFSLRQSINKKGSSEGRTHLGQLTTRTGGAHFLSVLYAFDKPGWGRLCIVNSEGDDLFSADIDSVSRYRRWLLHLPCGTHDMFYDWRGGAGEPTFYARGTRLLREQPRQSKSTIGSLATCAALATYPQRRKMLKDAVASLAGQVDHLFIYLNNYREPPPFLLEEKYANRVHFIMDTNSGYRAAAKFYWLAKHRCYWLLCDDDIIYPENYASAMKAKIDQYERRAIVGVHGTIFEHSLRNHILHHRILFERALGRDSEVHMLGTGTLALHSSILSRQDCLRLLRHPVTNDEVMAVISKARGIRQIAVERDSYWLRSNPRMKYGLFEETQLNVHQSKRVSRILGYGAPWSTLPLPSELKDDAN